MAKYGGWAGKVLHVDLSTGRIWPEDTVEKYKDDLGGTGIGYQVMWDEVPAGTKPYDPDNRMIFAVGPLAGTGAPCNGRMAITTLWLTCWPRPLVATGHMGGQFAAKLKYAGYDAIVIKGRADRPVWLSIVDKEVKIQDARHLWGKGIRWTTEAISQVMGPEAVVAAIGQAGENRVPMSVVMNSYSHSAGGLGAVMGSKNLKAVVVQGTESPPISDPEGLKASIAQHYPIVKFTVEEWAIIDKEYIKSKVDLKCIGSIILAIFLIVIQRYYGQSRFFSNLFGDYLSNFPLPTIWSRLYSMFACSVFYLIIPYIYIRFVFHEKLKDQGWTLRGIARFKVLYIAMILVVLPLVVMVSFSKSFSSHYPLYSEAGDSLASLIIWELSYGLYFVVIEFFFRGFMVFSLARYIGVLSIFVMDIPYVMIHFGKPISSSAFGGTITYIFFI